jgi:hypothetical protein
MIPVTVAFLACIEFSSACWYTSTTVNVYTDMMGNHPVISRSWCEHSAAFYLRDLSRVSKGNVPNYVAPSLQLGYGRPVLFDPNTIDCWPVVPEGVN